jgi:antitoxin component of MazEF toxin-antitoxin module
MTTLRVERSGEDLVIRLPAEAQATLGLREGDMVALTRGSEGAIAVVAADVDHEMRARRGRAFLKRVRVA